MATVTASSAESRSDAGNTLVDPRAPRFGQAVTASALLLGVGLQEPAFVFAIALIQNTAVWSRWRLHPYSIVWRKVISPALGAPDDPEPAAPHRFATFIGAVLTGVGSIAILIGFPLVGYVLAGAVAAAAGLGAVTGFCLGCYFYRSVGLFRRLNVV